MCGCRVSAVAGAAGVCTVSCTSVNSCSLYRLFRLLDIYIYFEVYVYVNIKLGVSSLGRVQGLFLKCKNKTYGGVGSAQV